MILEVVMDDRYIGVFDSGLGGITVLNELIRELPNERFIFLADTLRSPYGDKSRDELYEIVYSDIDYLISRGVKAIVFACNTASSLDLNLIRSKYSLPIITVLEATLEDIEKDDDKILVCATQATINSQKHKKLINTKFPDLDVVGIACPKIVPSIEFEDLTKEEAQDVVDGYLDNYSDKAYKALVLGCTHYPIWQEHFTRALEGVRIVNPAHTTAILTRKALEKHNILSSCKNVDTRDNVYLVTSDKELFKRKLKKIFDISPKIIEKIHII